MAQAPKALKTSSWQFTVKKLIQCSLKHRILRSEETWTPFSFQDWLDHPVNVVRPQSFQLVCQGHNIDFIPSTHAECPTHKVNSVFLDVQLLPKKAHSASVKRTAYHRDPGVGGRDRGHNNSCKNPTLPKNHKWSREHQYTTQCSSWLFVHYCCCTQVKLFG